MYRDFLIKYIDMTGMFNVLRISTCWENMANDFRSNTGQQPDQIISAEIVPLGM